MKKQDHKNSFLKLKKATSVFDCPKKHAVSGKTLKAYLKPILGGVIQLRCMHVLRNLIMMGQIFVVTV